MRFQRNFMYTHTIQYRGQFYFENNENKQSGRLTQKIPGIA